MIAFAHGIGAIWDAAVVMAMVAAIAGFWIAVVRVGTRDLWPTSCPPGEGRMDGQCCEPCQTLNPRERAAAVLQVAPNAEPIIVEAAFRKLAARHHPDHGGSPARFREIDEARAVLVGR